MTLVELHHAVEDFFVDMSRDKAETIEGLREIADACTQRAEALESELGD